MCGVVAMKCAICTCGAGKSLWKRSSTSLSTHKVNCGTHHVGSAGVMEPNDVCEMFYVVS